MMLKAIERHRNGAMVLHRQQIGPVAVWLCERAWAYQPYVTWVSLANSDKVDNGHYFSRFGDAYMDYIERVNKYKVLYE